jgi:uncharacterized protein
MQCAPGMETNTNAANTLTKVLMIIAFIGAINWGLIGFFNFNLVTAIFGGGTGDASLASRIIYAIVGVAGLVSMFLLPKVHAEPIRTQRYADRAV